MRLERMASRDSGEADISPPATAPRKGGERGAGRAVASGQRDEPPERIFESVSFRRDADQRFCRRSASAAPLGYNGAAKRGSVQLTRGELDGVWRGAVGVTAGDMSLPLRLLLLELPVRLERSPRT